MCFEDSYGPSLLLRNPELLRTLKDCKMLESVWVQFAAQCLDGDRIAAEKCFFSLRGFQNLTSLSLYNFYGEHNRLTKDIARVLSKCPTLKHLALGMACDCDYDFLPGAVILEDDDDTFLKDLSLQYASQDNARPLALQTLRLGHGMCLYESSLPIAGNFLAKFVDLAVLKTLHIFNGLVKYGSIDEEAQDIEIDWSLLKDCKSLRQLSVNTLTRDVRRWLNDDGISVQELIVTDREGMYDEGLSEFYALTLPRLSMLFVCEESVSKCIPEDPWTDTDSSATDPSDADILDFEAEGPSPESEKPTPTILDHLRDGECQLTKLAFYLNFNTQLVRSTFLFLM